LDPFDRRGVVADEDVVGFGGNLRALAGPAGVAVGRDAATDGEDLDWTETVEEK